MSIYADNASYTQLLAATATLFAPQIQSHVAQTSPLFNIIPIVPIQEQMLKQPSWDVKFSKRATGTGTGTTEAELFSVDSFAPGAKIDTTGGFHRADVVPAQLPWGRYREYFSVNSSELAMLEAISSNGTPEALLQLVKSSLFDCVAVIAKKIAEDIFYGPGSNRIIGLDSAINDDTVGGVAASYAGISSYNPASGSISYPQWNSYVASAATPSAPTLEQIRSDLTQISMRDVYGFRPSIGLVSPLVNDKLKSLFQQNIRYNVQQSGPFGMMPLTLNHSYVEVDGCALIPCNEMAAQQGAADENTDIFYINPSLIELLTLPAPRLMADSNRSALDGVDVSPAFRNFLQSMTIYTLGATGSSIEFVVECHTQLKVARRSAHGKRTSIVKYP